MSIVYKFSSQVMCKLRKYRLNFFFYFQKIRNSEIICKKFDITFKKSIMHVQYKPRTCK